jgi:hypothetical protein
MENETLPYQQSTAGEKIMSQLVVSGEEVFG